MVKNFFRPRNRSKKVKSGFSFDKFRLLTIMCVLTLIFVGAYCLYEVNSAAIKGYKIEDLEKKVEELREKNKKLGNEQAEYESTQSVRERISNLGMVAVKNIEYITIMSGGVAKK